MSLSLIYQKRIETKNVLLCRRIRDALVNHFSISLEILQLKSHRLCIIHGQVCITDSTVRVYTMDFLSLSQSQASVILCSAACMSNSLKQCSIFNLYWTKHFFTALPMLRHGRCYDMGEAASV